MLKVHAKNMDTMTVFELEGRIVNGETENLLKVLCSLGEKRAVIVDLARVTTIDAHGLGVMLELRQQALAQGTRFKLMNLNRPLSKVLEITRLDSVFEITSGVEFFPEVACDRRILVAA